MTTVQIVGIAVACAIVLLLVIALLVTRRRDEGQDAPAAPAATEAPADGKPDDDDAASFLDEPMQDSFGRLGKAEHEPVDAPRHEAEEPLPVMPAGPPAAAGPALFGRGLDLEPVGPAAYETEMTGEIIAPADETEATGEIRPAAPVPGATAAAPDAGASGTAEAESGTAEAEITDARSQRVPLSDIIVTTSDKVVDLRDGEVRRMLTDLITFEIDQATLYQQQGQTIDAVLQLTEAEKICKALGMADTAQHIRTMMDDLNA
jgi:hypothetical protein